ncbi:hypothetical protein ZWY2020_036078 [Hordeum vulgare]|nr:hypothetical protein ZWY2020_036078 [Hordeum vulgare]
MAMLVLALLPLLAASASAAGGCAAEAPLPSPNGNAYAACSDLPRLGATVRWTYDRAAGSLSVAFVAAPAAPGGWVAWGLNPSGEGMAGAQALLAAPSSSSGAWAVRTYNISGYALGAPGPIAFPATGLAAELGADGRVRVSGTLGVGQGAAVLNQADQHLLRLRRRRPRQRAQYPWRAQRRELGPAAAHGSHLREVPQDVQVSGAAWFYLHVTCQIIGYGVGVAGWATGINLGNESNGVTYGLHRSIGIAVFALATVQAFALFVRPRKDHKYRVYWNAYHHAVGYAVIVLGILNIFKGMAILGVEQRWRTAYVAAVWVLGAVAVTLEAVTWSVVIRRREAEQHGKTSNGHVSHGV